MPSVSISAAATSVRDVPPLPGGVGSTARVAVGHARIAVPDRWRSRFGPRPVTDGPGLREGFNGGYTIGMKTAVSIPDDIFEKVERLARRGQRSRSEVFSAALAEYVARHAPDEVTDAMNRVCAEVAGQDVQLDGFVRTAGRRVLENTEW
jgi:predicted transcriptional regulator